MCCYRRLTCPTAPLLLLRCVGDRSALQHFTEWLRSCKTMTTTIETKSLGEMLGLKAKRVEVPHSKVEVTENLVEVSGHLHFGPPKTRAGKRSVPLPKVAVAALDEHLRSRPLGPDDLVSCAPEGGPVRLAGWRRRVWAPAVSAAGVAPLRPHDLDIRKVFSVGHGSHNTNHSATIAGPLIDLG